MPSILELLRAPLAERAPRPRPSPPIRKKVYISMQRTRCTCGASYYAPNSPPMTVYEERNGALLHAVVDAMPPRCGLQWEIIETHSRTIACPACAPGDGCKQLQLPFPEATCDSTRATAP